MNVARKDDGGESGTGRPSPTVGPDTGGRPDAATVWEGLMTVVMGLIRTIDQPTRAEGLPLSGYQALVQLDAAPSRRLRLQELADAVVLSRSGLTRLVDRLEALGLVRREPAEDDRRGAYAVLTERGRETRGRLAPAYGRALDEHFTRLLSDEDVTALERAVEKLRAGRRTG